MGYSVCEVVLKAGAKVMMVARNETDLKKTIKIFREQF